MTAPASPRRFLLAAFACGGAFAAVFAVIPLLVLSLGEASSRVGLLGAVSTAGTAVGATVGGRVSRRVGADASLAIALVLTLIGLLALMVPVTTAVPEAAVLTNGGGLGLFWVASQVRLAGGHEQGFGRHYAVYTAGTAVAGFATSWTVQFLAGRGDESPGQVRLSLVLAIGLVAVALVLWLPAVRSGRYAATAAATAPADADDASGASADADDASGAPGDAADASGAPAAPAIRAMPLPARIAQFLRRGIGLQTTDLLFVAAFNVVFTIAPVVLRRDFALGPGVLGWASLGVAAAKVLGVPLGRRLAARYGERTAYPAVLVAAAALFAVAAHARSAALFTGTILGATLFGLGQWPMIVAIAVRSMPEEHRPGLLGSWNLREYGVISLAALTWGWLLDARIGGRTAALWAAAALLVASAAALRRSLTAPGASDRSQ